VEALAGGKPGEPAEEGLVSEVTWSLLATTLRRVESLISSKSLKVRRVWLAVPSHYDRLETLETNGQRIDRLNSGIEKLDVQVRQSDWPVQISAFATGSSFRNAKPIS